MRFLFELVPCCGSPRKEGERIRAVAPPAEAAPPEGEQGERRRWTGRRRKRRRGAAAAAAEEWKPSLCAISEDVVAVTVERVGGGGGGGGAGERRKKAAADPAPEAERSATSRKRSGGTYARVHDRVFNGDEYDHRRASFQAVIPAFSPAPFMF
ncbi:uncharacterized protein LOC115664553 [Syzygium oleosum]|uniref:uncharacterized protein LOC115664553 n=1 Tax=Syzygium oleosum TaxID=219896 RepID=UPI0024BB8920|nr:uncharacterized protein LOC115664553 [Syzygium oleosum]